MSTSSVIVYGPSIIDCPVDRLKPHPTNPRVHKPKQIRQIADSITQFGFTSPIIIDDSETVLAGHGRLAAAKLLGMQSVPTIRLDHMTPAQKRAYIIADNKLGDSSSFDRKILAAELAFIVETDPDFDLEDTGFDAGEIELLLDIGDAPPARQTPLPPPERALPALTSPGDVWVLGEHRLLCGDALQRESYQKLMGKEHARMVFSDAPYDLPARTISGNGKVSHGAFVMAAGEMGEAKFTAFLIEAFGWMAKFSVDGSLHYLCMDWRHQFELLTASRAVFDRQIDLCVWAKGQPGMGSPYRQQHELVGVFKRGTRAHLNNIELGKHGRNRSNLWQYSSGPSFSPARQEELSWHATVKNLDLVRDAILDASHRDDIVLDGFGGSGTTLIAAELCQRRARIIELDPYYCDVTVRRFEKQTGIQAHTLAGETFAERVANRDARPGDDADV